MFTSVELITKLPNVYLVITDFFQGTECFQFNRIGGCMYVFSDDH